MNDLLWQRARRLLTAIALGTSIVLYSAVSPALANPPPRIRPLPRNRRFACSRRGSAGCRPACRRQDISRSPIPGTRPWPWNRPRARPTGMCRFIAASRTEPPRRWCRSRRSRSSRTRRLEFQIDRLSPHAHAAHGIGRHERQDPDHSEILRRLRVDGAVRGAQEPGHRLGTVNRRLVTPLAGERCLLRMVHSAVRAARGSAAGWLRSQAARAPESH